MTTATERVDRFEALDTQISTPDRAKWLAGFFEVGGTIGFGVSTSTVKGKNYTYSAPFMKFTDNSEARVDSFCNIFGASKVPLQRAHSWACTIIGGGHRVAWMASLIEPFAPSRREIIAAISNWENASTTEEKIRIALESQGSKRQDRVSDISKDHYLVLINNPTFVAGIIDNRAYIYDHPAKKGDKEYAGLVINLCSVNRPLLEALADKFGGRVQEPEKYTQKQRKFMGEYIGNLHGTTYWETDLRDSANLLSFVYPCLLLRRNEIDTLLEKSGITLQSQDIKLPLIYQVIEAWRQKRGLTPTQISEQSGGSISTPYLAKLTHRPILKPGNKHLEEIARILNIPVSYLTSRILPDQIPTEPEQ